MDTLDFASINVLGKSVDVSVLIYSMISTTASKQVQ